jgi:ABC-2 type transport system permease protein
MRRKNSVIRNTLRACMSIFRIKTAEGFQYRVAGLAGAATSIFWVLIEITVYTVFYNHASNRGAGINAGLSLRQVISYAWLTQVFFMMQPMNIEGDILNKITNGDVGIEMYRPLDLYSHWFARTAASRLAPMFWRGSITLIAGLLMPLSYRLSPPSSLLGLFCMLLSIITALLLCTAYGMLISAIRLNIPWGDGPTYILMLIGGVLSGAYLPLQLWPKFLQGFLLYQPFAGYLDIPLRLYIGTLSPDKAFMAIGIQLVWILVFIGAGRALMTSRLKNIVVQGG